MTENRKNNSNGSKYGVSNFFSERLAFRQDLTEHFPKLLCSIPYGTLETFYLFNIVEDIVVFLGLNS